MWKRCVAIAGGNWRYDMIWCQFFQDPENPRFGPLQCKPLQSTLFQTKYPWTPQMDGSLFVTTCHQHLLSVSFWRKRPERQQETSAIFGGNVVLKMTVCHFHSWESGREWEGKKSRIHRNAPLPFLFKSRTAQKRHKISHQESQGVDLPPRPRTVRTSTDKKPATSWRAAEDGGSNQSTVTADVSIPKHVWHTVYDSPGQFNRLLCVFWRI